MLHMKPHTIPTNINRYLQDYRIYMNHNTNIILTKIEVKGELT